LDAVVFGKAKQISDKVDRLTAKVDALEMQAGGTRMLVLTLTTPSVQPGQRIELNPLIGGTTNKMLLKSIYIEGVKDSRISLELVSSRGTSPFLVYKSSTASNLVYDVLDLPYVDDDGNDALHINLFNTSALVESPFRIRITGLTVQ
jgi:hypothetical protein